MHVKYGTILLIIISWKPKRGCRRYATKLDEDLKLLIVELVFRFAGRIEERRLLAWNNSASAERNFMTFYVGGFFENLSRKFKFNPLKPELNPICYLLALLGAHHFLHISRIRVKLLTFRLLMSYIYIYLYIYIYIWH